jgi:hypothetical protein
MTRTLIAFICFFVAIPCLAQKKITVGVMPVFDASGDVAGEILTQHLTTMVYDALRDSSVQPVLLSPGGVYTPTDKEWALDFGRQVGVDAVLISTLQPSNRPKKGDWTVRVETELLDLRSGDSLPAVMHSEFVNRGYLNGVEGVTYFAGMTSRPFEKQELGKKAKHLAESMRGYVQANATRVQPTATAVAGPANGSSCHADFRIEYPNKSNSIAYSLIANRRDETLFIKEGVASLDLKSGPVVLQVKLEDAPYRLPTQRLYQVSTEADCSKPTLTMQIGPAGEALLRWQ